MIPHGVLEKKRATKETEIQCALRFIDADESSQSRDLVINTPVPFFTHMLNAMLFHGGWAGSVEAQGDVEVDYHHLIEDTGIVLGEMCAQYAHEMQPYARFGHAVIPMDDALAECSIDFSNRAYLYYRADFPQARIGDFDTSLSREFFTAFAHNARINIHLEARHGMNSHHITEAIYKACGVALKMSLQPIRHSRVQSTKGVL